MFKRKGSDAEVVTGRVLRKAFERIDGAFPAVDEGDVLTSILYRGIQIGARVLADDLTCGGCGSDYYEDVRKEADFIAMVVVLEKGILDGGKRVVVVDGRRIEDVLEEVLR